MEYASLSPKGFQGKDVCMNRQSVAGHAVGIVVLETWYPLLPGNVANASSFEFPIRYKVLREATVEMIMSADPILLEMLLEAGHEFEQEGIRAMVGACGYFANYQAETASALDIPVFLSSLLQVPMISLALKPNQKVGILVANAKAFNQKMLSACGIGEGVPIAYLGMEEQPEFRNILEYGGRFDYDKFEQEMVSQAKALIAANPEIGAILLECSDMPPFAWRVQREVGLPVYDFNTMINWIYSGVVQRRYEGFF